MLIFFFMMWGMVRVALLIMILVFLNIVFWGYVFYSRKVLKYKIDLAVQKNQLDEHDAVWGR